MYLKEKNLCEWEFVSEMIFAYNIKSFTYTPEKYISFSVMKTFGSGPLKKIKKINNGQAGLYHLLLKRNCT